MFQKGKLVNIQTQYIYILNLLLVLFVGFQHILFLSSLPFRLIDESGHKQMKDCSDVSQSVSLSMSIPIARAIKNHALMLT